MYGFYADDAFGCLSLLCFPVTGVWVNVGALLLMVSVSVLSCFGVGRVRSAGFLTNENIAGIPKEAKTIVTYK